MADEFDLKIAELEHKTALVNKEAAQSAARSGRTNNFLQFVVGGAITAGLAGLFSYLASTNTYKSAIREIELKYEKENREIDLELARLSLTILAGEYQEDVENSLPARMFALNALERGTGVTIPDEDKVTWAETGLTPGDIKIFGGVGTSSGDSFGKGFVTSTLYYPDWFKREICIDVKYVAEPICGEYRSGGPGSVICVEAELGEYCGALNSIPEFE